MDNLATPEIIQAASSSNLGIFSLMILVLGIIALTFFRRSQPWVQLAAFTPLFLGVAGFGYALMGADSAKSTAESSAIPSTLSPIPKSETQKEMTYDQTNVSITVLTGTGKHNETDSLVSVSLIGEFGSHTFELNNKGNDRESGEIDTYLLKRSPDIGPLREAIFQIYPQTGQKILDDWLVKSISILDKNRKYLIEKDVNKWMGDGKKSTLSYALNLNESN